METHMRRVSALLAISQLKPWQDITTCRLEQPKLKMVPSPRAEKRKGGWIYLLDVKSRQPSWKQFGSYHTPHLFHTWVFIPEQ